MFVASTIAANGMNAQTTLSSFGREEYITVEENVRLHLPHQQ